MVFLISWIRSWIHSQLVSDLVGGKLFRTVSFGLSLGFFFHMDIVGPTSAPSATGPGQTQAPSGAPSSAPVPQFVEVRLGNFYMSYRSTKKAEPTAAEYNQLVMVNEEYYAGFYTDYFANDPNIDFVSIQLPLKETRHGDNAGLPDSTYNIYMVRARILYAQ